MQDDGVGAQQVLVADVDHSRDACSGHEHVAVADVRVVPHDHAAHQDVEVAEGDVAGERPRPYDDVPVSDAGGVRIPELERGVDEVGELHQRVVDAGGDACQGVWRADGDGEVQRRGPCVEGVDVPDHVAEVRDWRAGWFGIIEEADEVPCRSLVGLIDSFDKAGDFFAEAAGAVDSDIEHLLSDGYFISRRGRKGRREYIYLCVLCVKKTSHAEGAEGWNNKFNKLYKSSYELVRGVVIAARSIKLVSRDHNFRKTRK